MPAPRSPRITAAQQPPDRHRTTRHPLSGARPRSPGWGRVSDPTAGRRFPVAVDRATGLLRLNFEAA